MNPGLAGTRNAIIAALGVLAFGAAGAKTPWRRPLPVTHPVATIAMPWVLEVDPASLQLGEIREVPKDGVLARFHARALPLARVDTVREVTVAGQKLVVAPEDRLEPRMVSGWAALQIPKTSSVYCTVRGGAVTKLIRSELRTAATRARLCLVDSNRSQVFETGFIDGLEAPEAQRLYSIDPIGYQPAPNDAAAPGEYVVIDFDGLPIQKNRFRATVRHSVQGRRSSYDTLYVDSGRGFCAYYNYFFLRYDPAAPSTVRFWGVELEVISLDRPARRMRLRAQGATPTVRVLLSRDAHEVPLARDQMVDHCD